MYYFSYKVHKVLNIVGIKCPESIMMIRKTIRKISVNEKLLIISDDPSVNYDIPAFCRFIGHKLIKSDIKNIPYYYLICKQKVDILI